MIGRDAFSAAVPFTGGTDGSSPSSSSGESCKPSVPQRRRRSQHDAAGCPVLREIARVLRPGGTLVMGELGKWSLWAAACHIRAWFGSNLWRRGRSRTGGELRHLGIQARLKPGPVPGSIYHPRWQRAARFLAGYDSSFGRLTTLGAAFLAFSAMKPARRVRPALNQFSRDSNPESVG